MTDQIRCELYHAFEGHCCPDSERCPLKPTPPAAVEVVPDHSLVKHGALMALVAVAVSSAVFVAFLAADHNQARQARVYQEANARAVR